MTRRPTIVALVAAALMTAASATALAQSTAPPPTIKVSAFNPPSLGSYILSDVPPGASPVQVAELRARVLETMAAMKQVTGPWDADGGARRAHDTRRS